MPRGIYLHKRRPILERFLDKVNKAGPNGCWIWIAHSNPAGYGEFRIDDHTMLAHRFSYEAFVGGLNHALELDHLCRNTICVNPDHLEQVSHRVNVLRGNAGLFWKSKSCCPKGHLYNETNTILDHGKRRCRRCVNAYTRALRDRYRHRDISCT